MPLVTLIAVIGVVLLQAAVSEPLAGVGGAMAIGFAFLAAALAVAIHEAWTRKRGPLGWIVNIVVAFIGCFVGANIGGMVMAILLSLFADTGRSLMATGGPVLSVALAGGMVAAILGAWGALRVVDKWR